MKRIFIQRQHEKILGSQYTKQNNAIRIWRNDMSTYNFNEIIKALYCLFETDIISIFHGCMVWIEKSVTRVTDRHHEACRVMPNSDPE